MCGRAGRKGVDDTGHAVLICNQKTFKKSKSLMTAETEIVKSQLDVYKLRRTLLESVATGKNTRLVRCSQPLPGRNYWWFVYSS